jgi:hypothetical protein
METQQIEINFQNVYENVTYKYINNERENALYIYWDRSNRDINSLMNHELSIYRKYEYEKIKFNAEWVKKIKECVGWIQGQVINFNIDRLGNGMSKFVIYGDFTRVLNPIQINGDGYLCIPYYERFPEYTNFIYIKCNCLYNDSLDGDNEPYVLEYKIICSFENNYYLSV